MSASTTAVEPADKPRVRRRGLRAAAGNHGLVLPAVVFLAVFFVLPVLYLLRFSFGLDRLAKTPEAAAFTGELTHFSARLWTGFLTDSVSVSLLGVGVIHGPVWGVAVLCAVLVLGVATGSRLRRWIPVACAVPLLAPFLTIPAGNHLLRLAELSSTDDSLRLFFRSVTMAMTSAAWSVVVAAPVAYCLAFVVRRSRYTWLLVILASFLASYLLRIFAWKLILGNQGLLADLLGTAPNFLLYSQFTVIFVMVYLWVPVVILPIFIALDGADPRLVEAAGDLGCNRLQMLRRVIAPAAAPGLAAGFLLAFIPSLGEYVTPTLVGGTQGYMFGQDIAQQFVGQARNWQTGSLLAMVLLAVVLFVMWCSMRGSTPGTATTVTVGRWTGNVHNAITSTPVRAALRAWLGVVVGFLYLPIAVLVLSSFDRSTVPSFPPDGFGLDWYRRAWDEAQIRLALWASARVGVSVTIVATILALLASYAIARRKLHGRALIGGLLALPLVIPPVVLGVSLLSLFQGGSIPIPLGLLAVAIGHVVIVLPYCMLLLLPRLQALDRRLEEAAYDLGASWLTLFRRVLLPVLVPPLGASLIVAFVLSMDEVVIASFLVADNPTYPVYVFTALRVAERTMLVLPVAAVMITVSLALVLAAEILRRVGERRLATF